MRVQVLSGLALLLNPLARIAPRDHVMEAAVEGAGAAAAFAGVEQGFDFAADFVERGSYITEEALIVTGKSRRK